MNLMKIMGITNLRNMNNFMDLSNCGPCRSKCFVKLKSFWAKPNMKNIEYQNLLGKR